MENTRKQARWKSILKNRPLALLIMTILLLVIFGIAIPRMLEWSNISLILLNMSAECYVLIAMAMLLISGDIDLSLGYIMTLSGIVCGRLMIVRHAPAWAAVLAALGVCVFCGIVNGIVVARIHVIPFIATMATGFIYNGIALVLAGTGYTDFPSTTFKAMGSAHVFGIQLPVYYMIVFILVFSVLVERSRYFRQIFYIGGNSKAAEYSGINIPRVRMNTYIISSLLVGLGGIVSTMRFNAAMTSLGSGVEMRAVTAAVIGGVSFTGGVGTIYGAAAGALFVAFLNNVLTMLNISSDFQSLVTGVVLIASIALDVLMKRRKH